MKPLKQLLLGTLFVFVLMTTNSLAQNTNTDLLHPVSVPAGRVEQTLKDWLRNPQYFNIARTTLTPKQQEPYIKEFLQHFDGVSEAWEIPDADVERIASDQFEVPGYLVVRQKAPKGEIRIKIVASGIYNAENSATGVKNVGMWIVQIMNVQADKNGNIFHAEHTEQRRQLVGRNMSDTTEKSLRSINPAFENLSLVEKATGIKSLTKLDPNKDFEEAPINP